MMHAYLNVHTHTHTHTLLENTLGHVGPMKAAIHIANLGALKRLHQMFSQKLCSLAPNEKNLCGP